MFCETKIAIFFPSCSNVNRLGLPDLFVSLTLVKRDIKLQFSAASRLRRFDWTSMLYFHFVCWIARSARGWAHSEFDFSSHCHKSLFDIHRILGRCFQKWYAQLIRIFLFKRKHETRNYNRYKLHDIKTSMHYCLPWLLYSRPLF